MDLENLTAEELEEINSDPKLAKAYKLMQADYTRKTQGASGKLSELEAQLAEANDYLKQWEEYGNFAQPIVKQFQEGGFAHSKGNGGDGEDENVRTRRSSVKSTQHVDELISRIEALENFAERATTEMNDSLGQLNKMFNYSVELTELQTQRFNDMGFKDADGKPLKFDLDTKKVLQTAIDKKFTSLKDAYETTYKEDFVKSAAEKRAEELYKERQAKQQDEDGTHRSEKAKETIFRLDPNRPKNFGEATEQAIKETHIPADEGTPKTASKASGE
jgi:hypothetical protein